MSSMYFVYCAGSAKLPMIAFAASGALLALNSIIPQTSTWPNSPAGPFGYG